MTWPSRQGTLRGNRHILAKWNDVGGLWSVRHPSSEGHPSPEGAAVA